jgi:RHS repeat-associated protein
LCGRWGFWDSRTLAESTTTTHFYYDGEDIVLQLAVDSDSNSITSNFVHGPGIDEPLARNNGSSDGSASYYYHADGLGSIVAITDANEDIVQRYSYDTFGMMTSVQDPEFDNSYAFTGREWDKELGLYFYRARYYDPMEGRFISKDPIAIGGSIYIQGVNVSFSQYVGAVEAPYRYTENNPVNGTDLSGLKTYQLGLGFNAGGILGTTKSIGLIFGENPRTGKWQLGFYATGGTGLYCGASASLIVDLTLSDNPCVEDVEGWAGTAGGSFGEFLTGGFELNSPMSDKLSSETFSVGVGGGLPAEGHGFATFTEVWRLF